MLKIHANVNQKIQNLTTLLMLRGVNNSTSSNDRPLRDIRRMSVRYQYMYMVIVFLLLHSVGENKPSKLSKFKYVDKNEIKFIRTYIQSVMRLRGVYI